MREHEQLSRERTGRTACNAHPGMWLQESRVTRHGWRLHGWRLWVSVAIAITATLLLIAQDQETLRVESPVATTDAGFVDYMASLVGAPVDHGEYTPLRNGDEVFPAMLDAIRQARTRISLESYIYQDGAVGDRLTHELMAAAARGVTVRMVLDAFGSSTLSLESRRRLPEAGVTLKWFNPLRPWTVEETNYRTHAKILVVDGAVAFTGGIDIADHWLGHAEDPAHWRDTQFKVTGGAVSALEAAFFSNWLESGGGSVPVLDPPPDEPSGRARSVVIWSNPTAGASNVKLLYLLSIAGARRTIDIQSPYVILDESTRWSLDRARERGVRIRILTEGDMTDARPVKYASRYDYQALLDSGFEIYEFTPTMMHVKAMTVDGVWSVIGSANFDNRSFELNDELTVAVSDKKLAAQLIADFDADAVRSKKLEATSWRNRSILQKSREYFWSFFGEIF
jgi:cardiolipin synthase